MTAPARPRVDLDWTTSDVQALRRDYAAARETFNADVSRHQKIEELGVLGASGLIFHPSELVDEVPILFFHGGGWVAGAPQTHRALCCALARESGRRVVALRYRLAPEHPFPAQKVDAVTAVNAILTGRVPSLGSHSRIVLAGDSAGAAVALWAEAGLPLRAAERVERVIGFYGAYGLRDSASLRSMGQAPGALSKEAVDSMYDRLGPNLPEVLFNSFRPRGAPLTLLAAGRDSLADDSRRLARWAMVRGREVRLIEAEGMEHGFLHAALRSDEALSWMRRAVRPGPVKAGEIKAEQPEAEE